MTATNHAVTGAVISFAVKRPELAIPLAFVSHYLIDVIPHFEARDLPRRWPQIFIGADVVLCSGLVLLLLFTDHHLANWIILASMAAAIFPDSVWGWRYLRLRNIDKVFEEPMSSLSRWHLKVQLSESLKGISTEIIWLIVMALFVVRLR